MDGGGGEALPLVPTANLLPAFPLTILVAVPERLVMLEGMRDEADLLTVTAVKAPPQHGHRLRGKERQSGEEGRAAPAPMGMLSRAVQRESFGSNWQ